VRKTEAAKSDIISINDVKAKAEEESYRLKYSFATNSGSM
jgi:hypothetical protein